MLPMLVKALDTGDPFLCGDGARRGGVSEASHQGVPLALPIEFIDSAVFSNLFLAFN